MKAGLFTKYGPIKESLAIDPAFPKPTPKPGQALIRVHAASVNPVDWKILEGYVRQFFPIEFPHVGGWDVSGTIESFGDAETEAKLKDQADLKVGDEVYSFVGKSNGTFAEWVAVGVEFLQRKPKNLSHEEAATVPLVALTSYQAVLETGQLTKGQKLLVLGGSSGTGIAAIQLAKRAGAYVAATAGQRNLQFVTSLGADQVIDYNSQDWSQVLKGQDFDLIYDAVGDRDGFIRSANVLKRGGRYVAIAGSKGTDTSAPDQLGITFHFILTRADQAHLADITKAVEEGAYKTKVHGVYSLDKLADALEENKAGHVVGKLVIKVI